WDAGPAMRRRTAPARERGPPTPQPRLPAAPGRAAAVRRRHAVQRGRLPAAGARTDPVAGEGGRRLVRTGPSPGAVRPARRRDGRAGGVRARRPAARRSAVRALPRPAVPGRRGLLRVLDRLAAGHAGAVPAATTARPLLAGLEARPGCPLPLEPSVPAHLRIAVRAGQLHRPRPALR